MTILIVIRGERKQLFVLSTLAEQREDLIDSNGTRQP